MQREIVAVLLVAVVPGAPVLKLTPTEADAPEASDTCGAGSAAQVIVPPHVAVAVYVAGLEPMFFTVNVRC